MPYDEGSASAQVGTGIQVWTKDSDSCLCAGVMIREVYTVSRRRKPGHVLRGTREEGLLEKSET